MKHYSEAFLKFVEYYELKYPDFEWTPLKKEKIGKFEFILNGSTLKIKESALRDYPAKSLCIYHDNWLIGILQPFSGTFLQEKRGHVPWEDLVIQILDKYIRKMKS